MTTQIDCQWDKGQVKLFIRQLRKELGDGWDYMVPAVRRAFVHAEAFKVVRSQVSATIAVRDMNALLAAMEIEAGLQDPE
jgi:hypothetical protein